MKIQNTLYSSKQKYTAQHFTSNYRCVFNAVNGEKKLLYKNNTCFFRDDVQWEPLVEFLEKWSNTTEKVTIYSFGCSEGAEPFSLAMLLIEKIGKEKAKKFFPIIASDIDSKILENPKRGIITVSKDDLQYIKKVIGESYRKYITFDSNFRQNNEFQEQVCLGQIKPILEDTVTFKTCNFADDIPSIKPYNSFVMCRNFLNYYNYYTEQRPLVKRLSEQLGNNSFCLLGDYDGNDMINLFTEMGFTYPGHINFLLEKEPPKQKGLFANPLFWLKTHIPKNEQTV